MALKLSGSISLTGSLTTDSNVTATAVTSSFFTGSYLDSLGHSGSADEILISDGRGGSTYKAVVLDENADVRRASANKFAITWQDNLNFTASATSVYIPGEDTARSQLGQKNITLAAADSTHPRFDVFIFSGSATDPSSGSVEVVQGTASENPIYPDIDPGNEVPLKFILLKAGSSVPSDGSDENNTNGADFVGSTVFSDNADDGNSWKSFGTSAASANITTTTGQYGASYFDQFDYGDTTYGNAIKWPRTGTFENEAKSSFKDQFGFWHPNYNESESGLTLGTLDALEFELKMPSSATGSVWWTTYVKEGRQSAYFQINLTEAQRRNSDGTINRVAPAAFAKVNFRDFVDLTRDDFQKISIPANNFQGTGNGGAGSKIILINGYLYKSRQYVGPLASAGDGIYIKNLRWVDGSGAAPTAEPTGKTVSQGSAARPTALSGKQNTLSSTAVSSVVVSGENNRVTTKRSFIGAGRYNLITGNTDSVIGGGSFNSSSNSCTFIGGGSNNILTGSAVSSSIIGGLNNSSSLANTHIIGSNITADKANYTYVNNIHIDGVVSGSTFSGSFVGDGSGLTGISGVGGGGDFSPYVTSSNGTGILPSTGSNFATVGNHSVIGGGSLNTGSGAFSGIGGGCCNKALGDCDFIGGGICNTTDAAYSESFIGGGSRNCVDNPRASIVGGHNNINRGTTAHIGGGHFNTACGSCSGILAGQNNCTEGGHSTVVSGILNCACGNCSGILGGRGNTVTHIHSFAVGSCLTSNADCTLFVNNLYSTGSDGSNNVVILANLPTSDPTNAGQLWNDSGTLKISAG